ncbi:MAG: histidine phosphatase family protein [Psychroserpens sp.]|uniref:SixA phosphatase family protein n=1 Tax=Psychroserpens sp. TaxID=2020870 RepID=UPI003C806F6B
MKLLTLVRHGKSSWQYDVDDRDRPLKKRGIKDANLVSMALKSHYKEPDMVFSSPANRALSTAKIFVENLNINPNTFEVVDELYDFGGDNVIRFFKALPSDYKNIMIFGHNHAFTSICNIFGDTFIDNLPTSALVCIKFEVESWAAIDKGTTETMIFPRDLK